MFLISSFFSCHFLIVFILILNKKQSVFLWQSHDQSVCIRPNLPGYEVEPQNISLILMGDYVSIHYSIAFIE